MKLNAQKCNNAKPKDKPYRLFDGGGLYLEVMPSGSKLWRLKYRYGGKEKRLSFGSYPVISLKAARDHCITLKNRFNLVIPAKAGIQKGL